MFPVTKFLRAFECPLKWGKKLTDTSGGLTGISAGFLTANHEFSSGVEKKIVTEFIEINEANF